ncbi:RraA family protein [Methanosphaera sp.]
MSTGKITPKNILHFNKKQQKKINLENILEKASTDTISDAMKNLYGTDGLIIGLKPIEPSFKIVGKIRTAETNSYDWGTCIKAIYTSQEDEILFIKCSDTDYAVWGEMASKAAQTHGLQATVVYGTTRDTNDIIKLNYPVFSKDIKSRAGLPSNEGTINERLIIDNMPIINGDILVGDRDGVVIIPQEKLEEVLEEVTNIKKFESECLKRVEENNENLDSILGIE